MKFSSIKVVSIVAIVLTAFAVSLPGVFSSNACYSDGQRYIFNGILIHDMIRDGQIFDFYAYSKRFYAQYPAINLPYGPPFFAVIYAVAFKAFGISISVARFVVASFTALTAIMCCLLFFKAKKQYWTAILGAAVFIAMPLTGIRSRDVGPEMVVSFFSLLTIYFFLESLEEEKRKYILLAALALGLGYLTKPYIVPLGLALPLFVIVQKKWEFFTKKESWLAVALVAVLTVPYTFLSFKYSNEGLGFIFFPPVTPELLLGYPKLILKEIPVLTAGASVGFIIGVLKKDKLTWLCLIWAVCWYLFHTLYYGYYIGSYYLCSLILAMLYPFGTACQKLISLLKACHLDHALICIILIWLGYNIWTTPRYYVKGYERAGRFTADNYSGASVLFYGTYDGSFMMGVRKKIPIGGPYILRGERCLSERLWRYDQLLVQHVNSEKDLIRILQKYRTGCVVIEKDMPSAANHLDYKILSDSVENLNLFKKLASFPIHSNYTKTGPELAVYQFLLADTGDKAGTLSVPVPTLKETITMPF